MFEVNEYKHVDERMFFCFLASVFYTSVVSLKFESDIGIVLGILMEYQILVDSVEIRPFRCVFT